MNRRNYILGVAMALVGSTFLAITTPAHATAILSTSGNLTQGAIPASLLWDAAENTQMVVYREALNVILASPVMVNFASSGHYAPNEVDPDPTINITAGTMLTSFLFHLDPPDHDLASITATITFDADILGIITSYSGLTATDALLGAPGTTYDASSGARGMEPGTSNVGDNLDVSANLRTLTLNFGATTIDEIRVLVGPSNEAPEPGTLALVTGSIAALSFLRRRH